ncbi:hypothetical protein H9P43_003095 [Blastocladiella emersonii ATCC 22665]|nr:hypothetical protein H9P43_003095 [Blastocladiella emersonii ATCC 22665]
MESTLITPTPSEPVSPGPPSASSATAMPPAGAPTSAAATPSAAADTEPATPGGVSAVPPVPASAGLIDVAAGSATSANTSAGGAAAPPTVTTEAALPAMDSSVSAPVLIQLPRDVLDALVAIVDRAAVAHAPARASIQQLQGMGSQLFNTAQQLVYGGGGSEIDVTLQKLGREARYSVLHFASTAENVIVQLINRVAAVEAERDELVAQNAAERNAIVAQHAAERAELVAQSAAERKAIVAQHKDELLTEQHKAVDAMTKLVRAKSEASNRSEQFKALESDFEEKCMVAEQALLEVKKAAADISNAASTAFGDVAAIIDTYLQDQAAQE